MANTATASVQVNAIGAMGSGSNYPSLQLPVTFPASGSPSSNRYTSGTGTNPATVEALHASRQSVGTNATTLNLQSGALLDAFGVAMGLARATTLIFRNQASATNTADVVTLAGTFLGSIAGGTNGIALRPQATRLYDDPSGTGFAVTVTTADTITLTASTSSASLPVPLDVWIAGRKT